MNKLKISTIDLGIVKCYNQASQLIIDADLLLENKSYSTAYSLYQLASEESSKIKILIRLAIEKRSGMILMDEKRGKYFKKLFSNHNEKIKLGTITDQNFNELAEKINLPKFRDETAIQNELNNPKELNLLKQDGFYVAFRDNAFISPTDMLGDKECKELRSIIVPRHKLHKWNMEEYFQNPEFLVRQFVNDIRNNQT